MQQLLVVADRELPTDWLRQSARGRAEVSHCATGAAAGIVALAGQVGAGVVLVDFSPRDVAGAAAQVRALSLEGGGQLLIAGIGEDDSPDTVLAAVRAGARDFLRIGSSADEVEALLDRLGAQTQASAARQCTWFAVLSARPGVDATLFAVHLAVTLGAAHPDGRGLLLDLGLPPGDAPLLLGTGGEYTVADALRSLRRLDETLIDTAVPRHASGLHVLSLVPDAPVPAVNGADLQELTTVLGAHCAVGVLNLSGWTEPELLRVALRTAQRSALVVDATVPSCRSARALLDRMHLERVDTEPLGLVVDGAFRGMQMVPAEVARGLGISLWGELPASAPARHLVLNGGDTLFALRPKDPYAQRVRELAARLRSGQRAAASAPRSGRAPLQALGAWWTALRS